MAYALGMQATIVTSLPIDLNGFLEALPAHTTVANIPTTQATTFENLYTATGRTQTLSARATVLTAEHIAGQVADAAIVHLAPVADEIASTIVEAIPTGRFVLATPQGWMRGWDAAGHVFSKPWQGAGPVLARADLVVMGIDDVAGDESTVQALAARSRVLAVTYGRQGSIIYASGDALRIPAPEVAELDPTGAGDIYATAFAVYMRQHGDVLRAARFATRIASDSVQHTGLASIPAAEVIALAYEAAME